MLTAAFDFLVAFTVMCAWAAIAFVLLFIGYFLMDLIGERVYGKQRERRR